MSDVTSRRQRRALQHLASREGITGQDLENAVTVAEAITPAGDIDLARMRPDFRELFTRSMRRRVAEKGVRGLASIIDSADPENTDPLGLFRPTVYPPETTKNTER